MDKFLHNAGNCISEAGAEGRFACVELLIKQLSAVHRSRRAGAGAGVLTNFAGAGAGAGVCSPPAKLRQHLFVLQTSIIDQRKN